MEYKNIIFEKKDGIGYVTMNRPKALNALNTEVLTELDDVFRAIDKDDEVQVAIVTGEGRSFIAGADIAQMSELNGTEGRDMTIQGQLVMELIETINKPVIAAVNGFALGGGNELAMACDIRIASEKAKFGQPEVNLGIIPGYGGTQRLPRLVGKGMAKKLIYSAEMIDAQEAYRIGLVQEVVPAEELMEAAEKLAADGIDAKVINIHTIKPLDEELVIAAARETGRVVTVEEHSVIGGLGSAVCDVLSEKAPTRVMKIGINDTFGESGPALELLKKYGLDTDSIYAKIKAFACE